MVLIQTDRQTNRQTGKQTNRRNKVVRTAQCGGEDNMNIMNSTIMNSNSNRQQRTKTSSASGSCCVCVVGMDQDTSGFRRSFSSSFLSHSFRSIAKINPWNIGSAKVREHQLYFDQVSALKERPHHQDWEKVQLLRICRGVGVVTSRVTRDEYSI